MVLQQEIEKNQITGILEKLKGESLKKEGEAEDWFFCTKGLKGAASIPTDDLIPPIRPSRNCHSLTFQNSAASTDINKGSFFPHTVRDWKPFQIRL